MLIIYTTPSCSSCRKAKKWLDEHRIEYHEKNIFHEKLTEEDLDLMLTRTENGFSDIISTRSKVIRENEVVLNELTVKEAKNFILDNPSILKRPIIIDDNKMQVGYNDEEIRVFIPFELRQKLIYSHSTKTQEEYLELLQSFFEEQEEKNAEKLLKKTKWYKLK